MVNGRIQLSSMPGRPINIHRGMIILTCEGDRAGFSAGVLVNQSGQTTYIVLGRLPVTSEYRLIPPNLVACVEAETIHLIVNCEVVKNLRLHQSCQVTP